MAGERGRFPHDHETETGLFGVEVPRRYEASGEAFYRCRTCGVLYDECEGNVCATKLARALGVGDHCLGFGP